MPTLRAHSIARPLLEALRAKPFSGYVLGSFAAACIVTDEAGRVIILAEPGIGDGPFSMVIEQGSRLFATLPPNQSVQADGSRLTVGAWSINLDTIVLWEPRLPCPEHAVRPTPATAEVLTPYTHWPRHPPDAVARRTAQRLTQAASALQHALAAHQGIDHAVAQVVGLGPGLTPAGDDYLLGVSAALWLTRRRALIPNIAQRATPGTTALSAAFLNAAARGHFAKPWHEMTRALTANDPECLREATNRFAQWGASSGRDALAGFTTTLFSLPRCHAPQTDAC